MEARRGTRLLAWLGHGWRQLFGNLDSIRDTPEHDLTRGQVARLRLEGLPTRQGWRFAFLSGAPATAGGTIGAVLGGEQGLAVLVVGAVAGFAIGLVGTWAVSLLAYWFRAPSHQLESARNEIAAQREEQLEPGFAIAPVEPTAFVFEPIVNLPGNPLGCFFHLEVANNTGRPARKCLGRIVGIQKQNDHLDFENFWGFRAEVELKWTGTLERRVDIDADVPRRLDLCFGVKGFDRLFLGTQDQGPTGTASDLLPGVYRVRVRLTSESVEGPSDQWFEITHSGRWDAFKVKSL